MAHRESDVSRQHASLTSTGHSTLTLENGDTRELLELLLESPFHTLPCAVSLDLNQRTEMKVWLGHSLHLKVED